MKVWDLASGTLLRDLHGHTDFIYSLVFSNDSASLASGQLQTNKTYLLIYIQSLPVWYICKCQISVSLQTEVVNSF